MKKISALIVLLIFGYLLWNISHYKNDLVNFWGSINFLLVTLFALPIYLFNILAWHATTRVLNFKIDLLTDAQIWMYSNISRFLPGGIFQYPSRIFLLTKQKVSHLKSLMAILLELLFSLGVGGIFSLSILTIISQDEALSKFQIPLLILLLFFVPLSFGNRQLINIFSKVLKKLKRPEYQALESLNLPTSRLFLLALAFSSTFIFPGLTLFALSNLDITKLPTVLGMYAFSWMVGYLSIFAPGGFGVMEAVLAFLLSFYMPLPTATLLAIIFRVVLLSSEALSFLGLYILARLKD